MVVTFAELLSTAEAVAVDADDVVDVVVAGSIRSFFELDPPLLPLVVNPINPPKYLPPWFIAVGGRGIERADRESLSLVVRLSELDVDVIEFSEGMYGAVTGADLSESIPQ